MTSSEEIGMETRMRRTRARVGGIVALAIVAIVGCSPAIVPSAPAAATQVPSVSPPPATSGPSPTLAGLDAPPEATLAAEGGDPVMGQLGSFSWLETGSASPWLPGAPISVGAGEPLTVALVPAGDVAAWRARYVPAAAGDPVGAVALGEGGGDPAFTAPRAGSWTVEVVVEFALGVGEASYFWWLQVE
jgi:hypothetical protein